MANIGVKKELQKNEVKKVKIEIFVFSINLVPVHVAFFFPRVQANTAH